MSNNEDEEENNRMMESERGEEDINNSNNENNNVVVGDDLDVDEPCYVCQHLLAVMRDASSQPVCALDAPSLSTSRIVFKKIYLDALQAYLEAWLNRQCVCLFRDSDRLDAFCLFVQHLICFVVQTLKSLSTLLSSSETQWSPEDIERLLVFTGKLFLIHFPLYSGPKLVNHKFEMPTTGEATQFGVYCDSHHDPQDFPVWLLRNVTLFCKSGGLTAMKTALSMPPQQLPPNVAQALITVVSHIKVWLTPRAAEQLFVPVRNNALAYLTKLPDAVLRLPQIRTVADFLWSSGRERLNGFDYGFDQAGLDLALKYFCSPTLTMRLCGVAQINAHVHHFNELCHGTENVVVDVESQGVQLAQWIVDNCLVEHIFGPNLHVEVIKQSSLVLSFLALEGKLSVGHVDCMWQASQIKHCSKQVHDLIIALVKNMEAGPIVHLFHKLNNLNVRDHNEQTIHLAQVLQRSIWTSGSALTSMLHESIDCNKMFMSIDTRVSSRSSSFENNEENDNDNSNGINGDDDNNDNNHGDEPTKSTNEGTPVKSLTSQTANSNNSTTIFQDLDDLDDYTEDDDDDDDDEEDDDDDDDDDDENDDDDDEDDDEEADDEELEDEDETVQEVVDEEGVREGRKERSGPPSSEIPKSAPSKAPKLRNSGDPGSRKRKGEDDRRLKRSSSADNEEDSQCSLQESGKRTKGLPVKSSVAKRQRLDSNQSGSDCCDSSTAVIDKRRRLESSENPSFWSSIKSSLLLQRRGVTTRIDNNCASDESTAMSKLARLVNAQHSSQTMRANANSAQPKGDRAYCCGAPCSGDTEDEEQDSNSEKNEYGDANDDNNSNNNDIVQHAHELNVMLQQQQQLANIASFYNRGLNLHRLAIRQPTHDAKLLEHYKLDSVCEPGNTLLWDLLQDNNIEQLSEGLASEAEKALATLLCLHSDRLIRLKFIEGCINNLKSNKSVTVSIRLLPKLLQSFNHFRGVDALSSNLGHSDTFEMCMIVERQHNLTQLFFDNLKLYCDNQHRLRETNSKGAGSNGTNWANQESLKSQYFNHLAQIQIRLHFLSLLFSSQVSPAEFRLKKDQVRTLWECLASDPVCSDDLFQWLLVQFHSKDQHALGIDEFRLIFNEKLPTLKPESISMLGLTLFSQLCKLSKCSPTLMDDKENTSKTGDSDSHGIRNVDVHDFGDSGRNARESDPAEKRNDEHEAVNSASKDSEAESDEKKEKSETKNKNDHGIGRLKSKNEIRNDNGHCRDVRMDQLWTIALRAQNTDVSMKAIELLNQLYFGHGEDFVVACMNSLANAITDIIGEENGLENDDKDNDVILTRVQRALLLLQTYLSKFRRKYAVQLLRHPELNRCHSDLVYLRQGSKLRVKVQSSDMNKSFVVDMQSSDLLAVLRADIADFYGRCRNPENEDMQEKDSHDDDYDARLSSIRLLTQGQELISELSDEKTLNELGFRDMQVVTACKTTRNNSAGMRSNDSNNSGSSVNSSTLSSCFPGLDRMPMSRLLQSDYFEKLFQLLRILTDMADNNIKASSSSSSLCTSADRSSLCSKARLISRRVWDILLLLPTNPTLMSTLKYLDNLDLKALLNPFEPHKLLYTLYIVDFLGSPRRGHNSASSKSAHWSHAFVEIGGLSHLVDIFNNRSLQTPKEDLTKEPSVIRDPCEWRQECLSMVLRLLVQFGVHARDRECLSEQHFFDASVTPKRRFKKYLSGNIEGSKRGTLMLIIPRLNDQTLQLLQPSKDVIDTLMSVLVETTSRASKQTSSSSSIFGRCQLVHHAMGLMLSLVFSSPEMEEGLFNSLKTSLWLRGFFLEDPDPVVRREVSTSLYRLFMGRVNDSHLSRQQQGSNCVEPLLKTLLAFLDEAMVMSPLSSNSNHNSNSLFEETCYNFGGSGNSGNEGKEPFGPACRDYFWLLCRLVDALTEPRHQRRQMGRQHSHDDHKMKDGNDEMPSELPEDEIDLHHLCHQLSRGLIQRRCFETRRTNHADEALTGMLNLLIYAVKHEQRFKRSVDGGQMLLRHLLDFLFALPFSKQSGLTSNLPKCKSASSRAACFDLVVEMSKNCRENFGIVHNRLMSQYKSDNHKAYPWEYWPRDEGRADCGYVGLTNLGATCYMASCVQQLFMIPRARDAILGQRVDFEGIKYNEPLMRNENSLNVDSDLNNDSSLKSDTGAGEELISSLRHVPLLLELQKLFAFLRESERKAYNPVSLCKTYEMNHAPLNTGEQKDMAEFFIDLLSKLEEMSPSIRSVVKDLFGGVQVSKVVSLDCDHVSSTCEDFYTVRCQVAEMRTLYQSLEEVTVNDTLEGDNKYTCSQCGKKVRAEKRTCFKTLPNVIAFNTMRYAFNMVTMHKEKVNTHFSFPLRLNMAPFMEETLYPNTKDKSDDNLKKSASSTGENNKDDKKALEEEDKVGLVDEGPKEGNTDKYERETKGLNNEGENKYEYELIGVVVHTGTAEGGHYYAFLKDRNTPVDLWYSFNDAEVKVFDPNQIPAECFGGDVSTRTYDHNTDKFLDLNVEKTNSAYMLFYEKCDSNCLNSNHGSTASTSAVSGVNNLGNFEAKKKIELSSELHEWVWQDNASFIQDNHIFDHSYFNFVWQMVGFVPTTLSTVGTEDVTLMSAQLSTSFFLESFIHAKEKLNIVQWVELLTKQFDSSPKACSWFLHHMANDSVWPVTIFFRCQVTTIRQMFHRLCIHVIQKLRSMEKQRYEIVVNSLTQQPSSTEKSESTAPIPKFPSLCGGGTTEESSSIARFIQLLVSLLESHLAKQYLKHMSEFFQFLCDFAKLGDDEADFMLDVKAISAMIDFYMKTHHQGTEPITVELMSDEDEDDDDIIPLPSSSSSSLSLDSCKAAAIDKMLSLITHLVEHSMRGGSQTRQLSNVDLQALIGSVEQQQQSTLPFLTQVTRENINLAQTCTLVTALVRLQPRLVESVANMIFAGVKTTESLHFFRLLTMLSDNNNSSCSSSSSSTSSSSTKTPVTPVITTASEALKSFHTLMIERVWELARHAPQAALDWLCLQASRNRNDRRWLLDSMEDWIEPYLLGSPVHKVRQSASMLVVSLVPSPAFRQAFRSSRGFARESLLTSVEDVEVLRRVLTFLFELLPKAKKYIDEPMIMSGQVMMARLVPYLTTLSHFLISPREKMLLRPHFMHLWHLFHPKLSEPSVAIHHSKQALISLWYYLCVDCPENVNLILETPCVVRNIAFNYILADHEDAEIVHFNRTMLPTYYGLLRLCCLQSRSFTRQLAIHQNIAWAFKNITPYMAQYSVACEELFKLMTLFAQPDKRENNSTEASLSAEEVEMEMKEAKAFRHQTLQMYLGLLDGRTSWTTLIRVLKILVISDEDRLVVVFKGGLSLLYEALNMMHVMFHEATACYMVGDLIDVVAIFLDILKALERQAGRQERSREEEKRDGDNSLKNEDNDDESGLKNDEEEENEEKRKDQKRSGTSTSGSQQGSELIRCLGRWKEMSDMCIRLLTLCNSFVPQDLRELCLASVGHMLVLWPKEMLSILVPLLHKNAMQPSLLPLGPFFPRKQSSSVNLKTIRPPRPALQIALPSLATLDLGAHGENVEYDLRLYRYVASFHGLVDKMVRVAVNEKCVSKTLVQLSTAVALDGVRLHVKLFPKLWIDIRKKESSQHIEGKYTDLLLHSQGLMDYIEAVLIQERGSFNDHHIHSFFQLFMPHIKEGDLSEGLRGKFQSLCASILQIASNFNVVKSSKSSLNRLAGDLKAVLLLKDCVALDKKQLADAMKAIMKELDGASQSLKSSELSSGHEENTNDKSDQADPNENKKEVIGAKAEDGKKDASKPGPSDLRKVANNPISSSQALFNGLTLILAAISVGIVLWSKIL